MTTVALRGEIVAGAGRHAEEADDLRALVADRLNEVLDAHPAAFVRVYVTVEAPGAHPERAEEV